MWSYSKLLLLVTALKCAWAQDFFEGKIVKKSNSKLVATNFQDGQGKENILVFMMLVHFIHFHSSSKVLHLFLYAGDADH